LEGEDNGIGMCVCPLCRGEGKVSCNSCGGTGRKIERRHHNVKIPAGVETGTRIRIADKGAQGTSGGPPGDLYVNVSVGENPLYERQGANLILDVPLTYAEAVLGADIVLPTLDGPISLKVPAFSESGRLLRVRGRGTPKLGERTRGDLFARLRITTPESITDDERDLLETLSDISSENPRAHFFTEPPQLDHSGIDQSNGDKGDDVVL
jgi:molecular chaperone DnaJ